jgi:4-hydroxybenzoate polyprenyltransferase
VKSSTRRLGEHVQKGVAGLLLASFVLVIAAGLGRRQPGTAVPAAGGVLVAVHLSRQAAAGCGSTTARRRWKLFKSNAQVG